MFLQMGVDRPNHVDPLQQNSLLVKTPVCGQERKEADFAEGIGARIVRPVASGRACARLRPILRAGSLTPWARTS
jgi:hypothetical protein